MQAFVPTHEITITDARGTRTIPVLDMDGALYTQQEWDHETESDWELIEGELRFQGRIPVCDEYRVKTL